MSSADVSKSCLFCGKEFAVRTNNKGHAKYCTIACRKAMRAKEAKEGGSQKLDAECRHCGKAFRYYPSQSPGKFCSRACKHADWKKPSAERGFEDISGKEFGRRKVLSYAGFINGHHKWLVRCSCESRTESVVTGQSLKSGDADSCGCIAREGGPRPAVKECTKCGKTLPFTGDFFAPGGKTFRWGLMPQCRACFRPLANARHKIYRRRLKHEVLSHYSGGEPKCACCGLSGSVHFLTLDHINDDGKEDRKIHGLGAAFYAKMKRLDYPNHLQVLCWSCNLGRRDNGGVCPHKDI